jgi:2,3-bisphosphoglycerate-dependent phosphoglycerate mutase
VKRALLIRHAESASNAGLATESPESNPLTEHGQAHADAFAAHWSRPLDLIVTSSYLRAKASSLPLAHRFPQVPSETWDIHEWTQLQSEKYRGTTMAQRSAPLKAYWDRNDILFVDGPGAESFHQLLKRVQLFFSKLAFRPEDELAVFTHGHFMRAVLWTLLDQGGSTPGSMKRFRSFTEAVSIPNLSLLPLSIVDMKWQVGQMEHFRTQV